MDIFADRSPLYIQKFVHDVCEYLGIIDADCELIITPEESIEENVTGLCSGWRDWLEIKYLARGVDRETKLLTIAHELVHAKQTILGELVVEPQLYWRGKPYIGFDQEPFYPWEEEAYRLETEIYLECKSLNLVSQRNLFIHWSCFA